MIETQSSFYEDCQVTILIHENGVELWAYKQEVCFGYEKTKSSLSDSKLLNQLKRYKLHLYSNSIHFTLIPKELYQEDSLAKYLSFAIGNTFDATPIGIENIEQQLVICFEEKKEEINFLQQKDPTSQPQHIISFLLAKNKEGISVYFIQQIMWISYFNQGKLHFLNGFHVQSKEETLYYLSMVCDKLELKFTETKFTVLFGEQFSLKDFWAEYIPINHLNIIFLTPPQFSPDLQGSTLSIPHFNFLPSL